MMQWQYVKTSIVQGADDQKVCTVTNEMLELPAIVYVASLAQHTQIFTQKAALMDIGPGGIHVFLGKYVLFTASQAHSQGVDDSH